MGTLDEEVRVISVGFGTKSLPFMVAKEDTEEQLHVDMHAEILAIQGFKKFVLK